MGWPAACATKTDATARYKVDPSRLKEYPVGITKATMRRGTPMASIDCIASGSAASDEVVEKAISAGDLTARTNRRNGTRNNKATGRRTSKKNRTSAA